MCEYHYIGKYDFWGEKMEGIAFVSTLYCYRNCSH